MEQLVRPFQLTDPTARIRVPSVPLQQSGPPSAVLCWGGPGTIPKPIQQADNFNGIDFRVVECDETFTEIPDLRKTENVRIEQKGQPNNYVIVQRIRQISFQKGGKSQYEDATSAALDLYLKEEFWQGSSFGPLSEQDKCHHKFNINR